MALKHQTEIMKNTEKKELNFAYRLPSNSLLGPSECFAGI